MNPPDNQSSDAQRIYDNAMQSVQQRMMNVHRLSKDEVLAHMTPDQLAGIVDKIGAKTLVVVDKTGRTVLKDPALRLPFHTTNAKFADMVAKEVGGVVLTFTEAIKVITDRNKPND
jgi:hypothetical protein